MRRLLRPLRPLALLLIAGALLGATVLAFAAAESVPSTAPGPTASAPSTAPSTMALAPTAPAVLTPPDPATLRAYDRPSDDGSAIVVEWAKPDALPYRTWYVIEMAEAKEAFAAKDKASKARPTARPTTEPATQPTKGPATKPATRPTTAPATRPTTKPTTAPATKPAAKPKGKGEDKPKVYTWKVDPGDGSLKSANPKYFGFSGKNETRYFASITPAIAVKGAGAGPLTIERIGRLVDSGRLDDKTAREVMAILRTKEPKDRKPTAKEKQMREWANRFRTHLGLAGQLKSLVDSGILTADDAQAVIAILKNTKGDDDLSDAEAADRKWLTRLKNLAGLTGSLSKLEEAGVLSADDANRAVAAIGNRKADGKLSDEEKRDRKWVSFLKPYVGLARQLKALRKGNFLREEDVKRALAILTLRKDDDKRSDREKADLQWLLRLKAAAPDLGKLKMLVEKEILTQAQIERVAAYVQDHSTDKELSEESKATQAWLERVAGWTTLLLTGEERTGKTKIKSYAEAGLLQEYVEKGWIKKPQIERIVRALRDQSADDTLAGQADDDRFWLAKIQGFLQKNTQKEKKAEKRQTNRKTWHFRVSVTDGVRTRYAGTDGTPMVISATAEPDLFKWFKLSNLVFALLFSAVVLIFIQVAKRRSNLFIRKIAGLEAVEEAIGRATEMGRAVYFVHGLGPMGALPTIAAVTVLGRVARRSAEYDTRVQVMNRDPIVTAVSQEVVKQGYLEAGRPDAYDPDDVALVAYDQFSYVAAVAGRMVRERPAAVFLIGLFAAESLLLAETGASTGAIQVAGTDSFAQLPFFITTCDYTLIGEELYAASAYLSREPKMLGSLRGQDVGKAFMMLVMVASAVVTTIAAAAATNADWLRNLFQAF